MKVVSVNVSLPKSVQAGGKSFLTGIFKEPVRGHVAVRTLGLEGDGQADLTVHGGPDKAVYLYPYEHYEWWRKELAEDLREWGAFGENLTVEGLSEDTVCLGDQFAIGTAVLQVTQPRLPCSKLAAKFGREGMIKRFLESRRTGFYVRVLREGSLLAGDRIERLQEEPQRVTIRELTDLYTAKEREPSLLRRVLSVDSLSKSWREHLERRA
jgi:MOSC domain-containing protein YiiM